MKTFVRQKPATAGAIATTIDFGAASAEVPRLFDPEVYTPSSRNRPRAIAPEAKQHWRPQRELLKRIWLTSDHRCAARE
jgi:hypothetical protein